MKDYHVLFRKTQSDIDECVNEWLAAGYVLVGGISVHDTGYYQAVAKPKD